MGPRAQRPSVFSCHERCFGDGFPTILSARVLPCSLALGQYGCVGCPGTPPPMLNSPSWGGPGPPSPLPHTCTAGETLLQLPLLPPKLRQVRANFLLLPLQPLLLLRVALHLGFCPVLAKSDLCIPRAGYPGEPHCGGRAAPRLLLCSGW